MTNVLVYKKDGIINAIEIKGHSGFDETGKDIVCSAISILAYTAINAMLELVDGKAKYINEDGFLFIEIPNDLDDKKLNKATCILETVVVGMKSIEMQYGSYIRIRYKEV